AYVMNERAGIKAFADLNGKPYSPGGQGTNAEVMTTEAFNVLGIKPQYYRGTMSEMGQAFKDRRIVGYVKATALKRPDPIIVETMTAQPIQIMSWPPELVQQVQAKLPWLKTSQIPAGVYQGDWNKQPITGWAVINAVFAPTKFPEDLAYEFTKVALADKTEQAAAFPALKGADIGKMTGDLALMPLHKGAVKALREAGYQVPQQLIPPEAK
ncbi:MAG: hypothetical protein HYU88_01575, partial [Chloroflexi bacterium]|nr:hypothetical protein [Chloroflexota bacterium]